MISPRNEDDRRTWHSGPRRAGLAALLLLIGCPPCARGDSSASHTVTVRVAPISRIDLVGGDVTLSVHPLAGSPESSEAVDATSSGLRWATNQADQKITVASSLAAPRFALRVEAVNVVGGTAAGEVAPSGTPRDLVTDVARGMGRCDLRYAASATGEQTPGTEVHTVTYTVVDVR